MISKEYFRSLRPAENEPFDRETFEQVAPRLRHAFPNFPDCVLEQWVYRHFDQFDDDYWWLGFHTFRFSLEEWQNSKILTDIGSGMIETQDYWGDDLVLKPKSPRQETWLAEYFHKYKTWPKPIVVLRNDGAYLSPDGTELSQPYHLLEGHMRLGYMRAFIRHSVEGVPERHRIWIATCDSTQVSKEW